MNLKITGLKVDVGEDRSLLNMPPRDEEEYEKEQKQKKGRSGPWDFSSKRYGSGGQARGGDPHGTITARTTNKGTE